MSLVALSSAQAHPPPLTSTLPSARPYIPCPECYHDIDEDTEQLVSVDVSDGLFEEQEEELARLEQEAALSNTPTHSGNAKSYPADASILERLTLNLGLWLDRISATVYGNTETVAEENETVCSKSESYQPAEEDPKDVGRAGTQSEPEQSAEEDDAYLYDTGYEGKHSPDDWKSDNRTMSEIPQYVLEYAPLVHLFSGEHFWPCDIADHLKHVTPNLNYTPILSRNNNLNLTNLDDLNQYDDGRFVYLKSNDNVESRPDWLGGQKNIPDEPEVISSPHHPHRKTQVPFGQAPPQGGRSSAPAVLVTVNKGHGIVDAFWFYFYSYNLGNLVFNIRFGNHIGDWEHSLVRFQHGEPKIVFFSEHFFGQAYSYDTVEKIGKRPVVYSAVGTHAMYAQPGYHPYILPLGLLHDQTDRGPLWDPAMNCLKYTYDVKNDSLTPDNRTADAPTEWFFFNGHWGDKLYPLSDARQYEFVGQYHYVTGPLGPRWKHLGRRKVCQGPYANECVIKQRLEEEGEGEIPIYPGPGKGEGEEDGVDEIYDGREAFRRDVNRPARRSNADMK